MTAQEHSTLLLLLSLAHGKLQTATAPEKTFLLRLIADAETMINKFERQQRNKELKHTSWSGW
jgi:hypothetical protein